MRRGARAAVAAGTMLVLAGCVQSACSCAAPAGEPSAAEVAPGESVTVELSNLWVDCCDTGGGWGWITGRSSTVLENVIVTLEAVEPGRPVLAEASDYPADNATASVVLEIPEDAEPGPAEIMLGGIPIGTVTIAG
ncbi:hypothetical protein [Demequina sp.]|uniref:hypothetical protein n=1 Tax=Demequina sp. TaxID=2050685 RepID=UPI0025F6917D|nr:hypothetical protein [Demequina sp.]